MNTKLAHAVYTVLWFTAKFYTTRLFSSYWGNFHFNYSWIPSFSPFLILGYLLCSGGSAWLLIFLAKAMMVPFECPSAFPQGLVTTQTAPSRLSNSLCLVHDPFIKCQGQSEGYTEKVTTQPVGGGSLTGTENHWSAPNLRVELKPSLIFKLLLSKLKLPPGEWGKASS